MCAKPRSSTSPRFGSNVGRPDVLVRRALERPDEEHIALGRLSVAHAARRETARAASARSASDANRARSAALQSSSPTGSFQIVNGASRGTTPSRSSNRIFACSSRNTGRSMPSIPSSGRQSRSGGDREPAGRDRGTRLEPHALRSPAGSVDADEPVADDPCAVAARLLEQPVAEADRVHPAGAPNVADRDRVVAKEREVLPDERRCRAADRSHRERHASRHRRTGSYAAGPDARVARSGAERLQSSRLVPQPVAHAGVGRPERVAVPRQREDVPARLRELLENRRCCGRRNAPWCRRVRRTSSDTPACPCRSSASWAAARRR